MVQEGAGRDVDVDVVDDGDDAGGGGTAAGPVIMAVDEEASPAAAHDAPVSVSPKKVKRKGKDLPPPRARQLSLAASPTATRVRRPPRQSLPDDDGGGLMPPPPRIPSSHKQQRKAAVSGETTPESAVDFGSGSEHDQDQDQDQESTDHDDEEEEDYEESHETRRNKSKNPKTKHSKNAKPKPSKPPKVKPETYKQAWSVSEQNLLEQLLDEIQDGERCRCVFFFVSYMLQLVFSKSAFLRLQVTTDTHPVF